MAAAEVQNQAAIKPRTAYSALQQSAAAPRSPHTPLLSRSISSQFGSPGAQRIEDEDIIFDIGSRFFRVGIAGEPSPKFLCQYGPDFSRRAGDYNIWIGSATSEASGTRDDWTDWELWDYELSDLDLGLVQDKLERALKLSLEKNLILDIKTRSAIIALPPALPNPLLELLLKTIFTASNHPKSVFLMSSPILCTISAGLRSALVVDLGWNETSVTVVYEYQEVSQLRSTRAGKWLAHQLEQQLSKSPQLNEQTQAIPFSVIDHVMMSLLWCRTTEVDVPDSSVEINVSSDLTIPAKFADLAEPVETIIGNAGDGQTAFDHHNLPIPLLMWKALLALPPDIRGICMSRIIFTGGCSNIPGLKARVLQELKQHIATRGWDPVAFGRQQSDSVRTHAQEQRIARFHEALRRLMNPPPETIPELKQTILDLLRRIAESDEANLRTTLRQLDESQRRPLTAIFSNLEELLTANETNPEPILLIGTSLRVGHADQPRDHDPSTLDDISKKLERESRRSRPPVANAELRAVRTLGAWAGASMMSHLRVEGSIEIRADEFLRHGMSHLGYPIH